MDLQAGSTIYTDDVVMKGVLAFRQALRFILTM